MKKSLHGRGREKSPMGLEVGKGGGAMWMWLERGQSLVMRRRQDGLPAVGRHRRVKAGRQACCTFKRLRGNAFGEGGRGRIRGSLLGI